MASIRVRHAGITAAILFAAAVPLTAAAAHDPGAHEPRSHATAAHTIFTFGRVGGNIRPLTVTIDDAGMVRMSYPAGGTARPVQLSQDALHGLLKLATAEGFYTMPARIIGHGNPDVGGRFITISTATGTKTVTVRFARNAGFDQLYAVLSAATGLQS